MKPKFVHDCDHCIFLGHFQDHDLYYHPGESIHRTIIGRWSSEGPDYTSGLCFIRAIKVLHEAARRAVEKGHLDRSASTGGAGQGTVEEELAHNPRKS